MDVLIHVLNVPRWHDSSKNVNARIVSLLIFREDSDMISLGLVCFASKKPCM